MCRTIHIKWYPRITLLTGLVDFLESREVYKHLPQAGVKGWLY
jgi:hypothetical protein